jgi:class 3 adenylate cyclase
MAQLPTGTVTFLFTDIEGSTQLLHRIGERYAEVLLEQQRLLRQALSEYGGVEVDTQGDSFFVAFLTAPATVTATGALAEQAWPKAGKTCVCRRGLRACRDKRHRTA